LQAVYPDFVPTKYHGYWHDKKHQKAFFDQMAIKLNIKTPEDWNKVTTAVVKKEGGHFVSRFYNSSMIQGTYYRQKFESFL
jgi:hypothetical protein